MPVGTEINRMFSSIAGRYDLLNRVLSLGTDRRWRETTCRRLEAGPEDLAVDLCCGTGDLALALARHGARVVAVDFSREMLRVAARKGAGPLLQADCLRLPFEHDTFDLATVAFGVRNLEDLFGGLVEMRRVLRPGGRVGILEFATPRGAILGRLYFAYLRRLVPAGGAIISGRRAAYEYLSTSIQSFPDQPRMRTLLTEAGFERVSHIDFMRGIAALYIGYKGSYSPG
ncbi:MAG TPA: bifunctional demethylmenaquinone methyltransferase/2-methoxy-6-polyprenyl-1,4-benzoquinol methylase UbiE [Candidatus Polarisedimenticolia bacterium]|nr:bifunctional demethylmenaquinone methyltransferase/2-methoxy-6-polyprenyl-1,4-benzoquinol methylase UbiE [Candidatus Polarisedimenticolia bacterium]